MARIILVRHGETDYNREHIIQGRLDIPLNSTGKEQARLTSLNFKEVPIDLIVTSPLIRAYETAEIIAREINYTKDILINQSFTERNFGMADGKLIEEYIELVHEKKVEGLEGEDELKKRMISGIKNISNEANNILLVCHSHSIKAVLTAIDPENYNFRTRLSNCSLSVIEYNNDEFKLINANINKLSS